MEDGSLSDRRLGCETGIVVRGGVGSVTSLLFVQDDCILADGYSIVFSKYFGPPSGYMMVIIFACIKHDFGISSYVFSSLT